MTEWSEGMRAKRAHLGVGSILRNGAISCILSISKACREGFEIASFYIRHWKISLFIRESWISGKNVKLLGQRSMGWKPISAVLSALATKIYSRKYWLYQGSSGVTPSWHDWKIVYWDFKPPHTRHDLKITDRDFYPWHKQTNKTSFIEIYLTFYFEKLIVANSSNKLADVESINWIQKCVVLTSSGLSLEAGRRQKWPATFHFII